MNKVFRTTSTLVLLAELGLVLRWATDSTLERLSTDDLGSLAKLVAAAVAWSAYGWLVLAVAVTVLERLPGALGQVASTASGAITSDASRTLLRSALGVAVAAPLTVGVAHAQPSGGGNHHALHWAPVEKASSVPAVTADWDPRAGTERASTVASAHREAHPPVRHRIAVPDRPTLGAATRYAPVHRPSHTVVVRPGDSLWAITADELGPRATDRSISARWPEWYAANAHTIGADPDLIHPGQVLHQPPE